jgi:acyl-CoA reductase-like NAD-dependent aldehyde dehydrogenase
MAGERFDREPLSPTRQAEVDAWARETSSSGLIGDRRGRMHPPTPWEIFSRSPAWFTRPGAARQVCEQIFGPVVVNHPFDTEKEVVELANGAPYGRDAQLSPRTFTVPTGSRPGSTWARSG